MTAAAEAVAGQQPAGLTIEQAGELVQQLGFLHVPGRPAVDGLAYLLVALRARPTLRHFDPERVDYWSTLDGRGVRAAIDRSAPSGTERPYSWGAIEVVDRKGIANRFASFGGAYSVARFDDVLVATFSSPAPLAACGGHSQGWDNGASEMRAFLARLRASSGSSRPFETQLAGCTPLTIYSAFVLDALNRHHDRHGGIVGDEAFVDLLRHEHRWLETTGAADLKTAAEICERLP